MNTLPMESHPSPSVLVTVLAAVFNYLTRRKDLFGSRLEAILHHGIEGMASGDTEGVLLDRKQIGDNKQG